MHLHSNENYEKNKKWNGLESDCGEGTILDIVVGERLRRGATMQMAGRWVDLAEQQQRCSRKKDSVARGERDKGKRHKTR